ncbi:MAG: family transcriptional regulator [Microbacteriaceae bacterium]|nr:family transcriptional regulator [Microbacteriaceae bacterium]
MSRASFGAGELFQLMRDGQPWTRAELAAATGLARSTIALRMDTLLALRLVVPTSDATSTGGRPSTRLVFNPSARVIAAADLGATHAVVALTDLSGTKLAEKRDELRIADGPEVVLNWLIAAIGTLLDDIARNPSDLVAVGLGVPGPVEHVSGKPVNPPIMPGWDGFDIPTWVQQQYRVPVLVDNDVNIMALGERSVNWPDADHLIFVKVATGIGSGIISGGELQRGADGIAGDIGHIPISRGAGIPCRCGNMGCLEAVAGGPAVVRQLLAEGVGVATSSDIIALVKEGNLPAIRAVRQAGRDIGEVLNMCVSIINPSVIVVGGSTSQSGEHLIAGIREVVYSRATPWAARRLTIVQSESGPGAGVIGASLMAIDHALSPDRLEAMDMAISASASASA